MTLNMRHFVTPLVFLALAACDSSAPRESVEVAPEGGAAGLDAPAAAMPAPTAATPAIATSGRAILDGGGIAFGPTAATSKRFDFGTTRAVVEAAAGAARGASRDRSTNGECEAGPMAFTRYGPLTLNFQDDKLVGWRVDAGADTGIVTSDGVRVGATIGDIGRERSVKMIDSTLDGEFEYQAADGQIVGGFATGTGDAATVSSLYAGVNCFFR